MDPLYRIQHTPIAARGKLTYPPPQTSPINTSDYLLQHQINPTNPTVCALNFSPPLQSTIPDQHHFLTYGCDHPHHTSGGEFHHLKQVFKN